MKLRIETRKVVNNFTGKKERKILKIEALDYDNLPEEYLSGYPHIISGKDIKNVGLLVESSKTEYFSLVEKHVYAEGLFQKLMGIIRQSGDRLHEINLRHKELRKEWNGKEDFEI